MNIAMLPFVSVEGTHKDLWAVQETGDTAADNATGREHALELVRYMRDNEAAPTLGHIVRAMVEKGRFGPIEIGFCQRIASAVL